MRTTDARSFKKTQNSISVIRLSVEKRGQKEQDIAYSLVSVDSMPVHLARYKKGGKNAVNLGYGVVDTEREVIKQRPGREVTNLTSTKHLTS
jgi:hypothetical protein